MSKYKVPVDLPGRVCRVLEAYTMLEIKSSKETFEDMVYRFTHIARGDCPHKDWLEDFEKLELEMEEAAHTSPAERERRDKDSNDK